MPLINKDSLLRPKHMSAEEVGIKAAKKKQPLVCSSKMTV